MNIKKIGIWTGGFIGLFVVLLILMYFLYPILKPGKTKEAIKQEQSKIKTASLDMGKHHSQNADSLQYQIVNKQIIIDSLTKKDKYKQQLNDSLRQVLKDTKESMKRLSASKQQHTVSVKEASKSLLSLEENSLGPIVNLLDEDQLIHLYEKASQRQREKLLRTLDPKKAASILKKVMK